MTIKIKRVYGGKLNKKRYEMKIGDRIYKDKTERQLFKIIKAHLHYERVERLDSIIGMNKYKLPKLPE